MIILRFFFLGMKLVLRVPKDFFRFITNIRTFLQPIFFISRINLRNQRAGKLKITDSERKGQIINLFWYPQN